MSTRRKRGPSIYLLGEATRKIDGLKLPTNLQVMRLFFFKHKSLNLSLRNSAISAISEVECFWKEAGIPIFEKSSSVTKLLKLHQQWKNLQKNRLRKKNTKQKSKEKNYTKQLEKIFDIARPDAEKTLTQEQLNFLTSQRIQGRRGFMSIDSGASSQLETRALADEPTENVSDENIEGK